MSKVALTKLSSKGQIVIPKELRESLHLRAGEFFAMFGEDETIVLKKIDIPTDEDFKRLLEWGSRFAEEKKINKEDILEAINELRSEGN